MTSSANALNNDLLKINNWAYQWKMIFNPDPPKQAQEVFFSCKIKSSPHPDLIFNNNLVIQTPYQKHVGLFLDDKLNFGEHFKYISGKVNKSIGLLHKLQKHFPSRSLVIIYKSFLRPYIDYGGVIFDQTYNKYFGNFSVQCFVSYNCCSKRYLKRKVYHELGFESLLLRLCTFCKIFKNQCTCYLYELLLLRTTPQNTRSCKSLPLLLLDTIFSKIYFFLL